MPAVETVSPALPVTSALTASAPPSTNATPAIAASVLALTGASQLLPLLPTRLDATRTSRPDHGPSAFPTLQTAVPQVRNPARYLLLGEHGRGGLGKVSRAHDIELGRDVAIKELLSRTVLHEVRFMREALITARLEHPGIVPVHEAGRWPDGTPFYAMKLVAGRPLRDLLAERKTVAERIALLHHVIAVADAIAYAHGRNIIHRDLKPGNVIVGDFGETVVIDWGLAKDLSTSDDSMNGDACLENNRNDDLTTAGTIVGTPAYMAPEQQRGEPVDQRADVYAIGAMLWELCSLEKLPPNRDGQRTRTLRESKIDQDLIAILDKAINPDPKGRYSDAGALAADLKAFKAGARIASRQYSPWGLIVHWTRRHRALALSAMTVAAFAIAGIAVYIRDISAERDRADAARMRTEMAKNDLTLEHAELLLHSDPTAAFTALSAYRGNEELRHRQLMAEAVGLGVAQRKFQPHTDTIEFLLGDKTGAIVSLGEDGRLVSTQGDASTLLSKDVSLAVRIAYAPSSGMLAYATSPSGIALLRLSDRAITHLTTTSLSTPQFSPDGSRLASLSDQGELTISTVVPSVAQTFTASFPAGSRMLFITSTRILVQNNDLLWTVALDVNQAAHDVNKKRFPNIVAIDAYVDAVAVGTSDGKILLLSKTLDVIGSAPLCRGLVDSVLFVSHRNYLAFSCHDGYSGLLQFDATSIMLPAFAVFPTQGSTYITRDETGRYIGILDDSNVAYLFDVETRLIHRYQGHAATPSYIALPTMNYPYVLTGDVNGTVRIWDAPEVHARLVLQASSPLFDLVFSSDSQILLANGYDPPAWGFNIATRSMFQLPGGLLRGTEIAPDGSSMLTYGYDGTIRVWRSRDLALVRTFTRHKGLIGEVAYIDSKRIVSAGEDGKLLQWSPNVTKAERDVVELFRCSAALRRLEVLRNSEHVVVYDSTGAVWDVSPDHNVVKVRSSDGARISMLRASPDGKFVAIGADTGTVTVHDTSSWQVIRTIRTQGTIRQIAFDPQGRDVLIASEAKHDRTGLVKVVAFDARRIYHWYEVNVAVRNISYAPDGDTIGIVTADGSTWLYSMTRDIWSYANATYTNTPQGVFSADGRLFATADQHGAVIVYDVSASLHSAEAAKMSPGNRQP